MPISHHANWSGNYEYAATAVHRPATVEQLQHIVSSASRVHALGTRHSFNEIADTTGGHISLDKFNRILGIDSSTMTVTAEAGVRYGQLAEFLHAHGYGLSNLASLPHISIAGACATATHGSGDGNGNLSTAVAAMEWVTADGKIVSISPHSHGDDFAGLVVNLGALGIVTKLTLKIVPTFFLRQLVYENLPFKNLHSHFEEILSSAYSVSLFTDWQGDTVSQLWQKRLITDAAAGDKPATIFGATLASSDLHPIRSHSSENCTAQGGAPGPWLDRLPHFRMNFTPSSGKELQSEYFIPRHHAVAALRAVKELSDRITPHLLISEIRTIAADNLWMSPCYQQNCIAIHFTWKQDWPAVREVLPLIEKRLGPFQPRPHWAKLFTMAPASVAARYGRLNEFRQLVSRFDPFRKFENNFIDRLIFQSK